MRTNVTFKSDDIPMAGHLYVPDDHKKGDRRAGVVVSHPFGGVKEQTAGKYAEALSERGFVVLTFDARYQGESGGAPRFLEDPFARAEDIKSAVTHLCTLASVDPNRVGALGICASGGYVPYAAQTDLRIKAIGTVSAADMGMLYREGLGGTSNERALHQMLEESAKARNDEAAGKPPRLDPIVPNSRAEITDKTPDLYAEGYEYYRTPRAQHPHSPNLFLFRSVDRIAQFSSYDGIHMLGPRPLLMIAGNDADTRYFSELAVSKAMPPAELFIIDGATHIDLYDREPFFAQVVDKLDAFYSASLGGVQRVARAA
ncbi:MAG: alpha/beta hydrolase [Polyangiaceae bacterium]|nr:alpha/beta hydrolase [Polyangiaceae bacterium]